MPSHDEISTSHFNNIWTLDEFRDLVMAWEMATFRPRDSPIQTLHDAVYKHFVTLRGGFTRRNKAALTSKRSALKFSYLFVRDYNVAQKMKNETLFFDQPELKRLELLSQWKKTNSSVIEITPVMFQALERIVNKRGTDETHLRLGRRKEQQTNTDLVIVETRPTRASATCTVTATLGTDKVKKKKKKKKSVATARNNVSSNPWSLYEMKQLIKAWGIAAQLVCQSPTNESMSIVHEMHRQFEILQGGKSSRNVSGLATRRRVLKQSYLKIAAFDTIQEMNGDPKFTELSALTRQNLIKSWKNANLLDLSAEIYSEVHNVIPFDTQAVALEDMRRAKMGSTSMLGGGRAGRKVGRPGRPPKTQKKLVQSNHENDAGSIFSLQPHRGVIDSEDEKGVVPRIVAQNRMEIDSEKKTADCIAGNVFQPQPNHSRARAEDILARQIPNTAMDGSPSVVLASKPDIEMFHTMETSGNADRMTKSMPVTFLQQQYAQNGFLAAQFCVNTGNLAAVDGINCGVERLVHPALHRDRKDKPTALPDTTTYLTKRAAPIFLQPFPVKKDKVGYADVEYRETEKTEVTVLGQDQKAVAPKFTKNTFQNVTTDTSVMSSIGHVHDSTSIVDAETTGKSTDDARSAKKKRKIHVDGPNGHLWENKELQILIDAWEKAAIIVCNCDPADRLSLNREMYREFVAMQGGSSIRNSTALAARRSSLKFSYAHIKSFNESQKAKGEPSYHEIPQDTRMTVLRSWKNRNSVDLTKQMYDGLGRIFAMDETLARVRSLRPPPLPKLKKRAKSMKDANDPAFEFGANYVLKTTKWTTEESSDLIKACADVMNVPRDTEQSAIEREKMIYDAFVIRRQKAGKADTPVRRDLRAMAQQWRHILASYLYIKECNDNRSENEGSSWFDMSAVQKRAYQQCTNVPLKFVDLNAEMFELVTSFMEVADPPLPSSVMKEAAEGISLRPRSTRKKTEAFWSSDSESSVSSMPKSSAKRTSKKDSMVPAVKKGSNWPVDEIWNLIQSWKAASRMTKNSKLSSALDETFAMFMKLQEGPSCRNRTLNSVRNKMIALKSSFTCVSTFIAEQGGDGSAWFDMEQDQRLIHIRGWNNKTIVNLTKDMFIALEQIFMRQKDATQEKIGKRKLGRSSPTLSAQFDTSSTKEQDSKGYIEQKPEKCVAANWSKEERLMLGKACSELLEGRRSRRYLFEEEKDRFFRRYKDLGGNNSATAAVGLARYILDSYEFIYFYNLKAAETNCLSWFELTAADRDPIVSRIGKAYRSFNGLSSVDETIYDMIDEMDAELRTKLGETKKKTYNPPNDAVSSRYVNIEAVVEQCAFEKRKHLAPKKPVFCQAPVQLEESSDGEADLSSSESSSSEVSTGSEVSAPVVVRPHKVVHSDEDGPTRLPRKCVVRRRSDANHVQVPSSRKRKKGTGNRGSSTLYITEIIQPQNRKLEEVVKRFRKDSADARKEHHAFLMQKIQDSFPVDTGNGSYLERVADRQGQTLVEIFQRLQQQRDVEKAKDEKLMRQLFGRSGLT